MNIVNIILIIALILLIPRCMVILSTKSRVFRLLGPVFLCYASGFLLSFLISDTSIAMSISEILVPVAIPLILFRADLSAVKRLARPVLLSFFLIILAATIVSSLGFFIFRDYVEQAHKYSGMTVGLYTGGTPNLIAIGMALKVGESNIVLANTFDMIVGGIYFFLLVTVLPKAVHKLLPYKSSANEGDDYLLNQLEEEFVPGKHFFPIKYILHRIPILLLAVMSTGFAVLISLLLTKRLDVMIIILLVTACGIGFSFIKKVRSETGSFPTGQYLIYMFSLAIGMSFEMTEISSKILPLLLFFTFVQFGSILLHFLLAKLMHIDGHIALITSTAGIYGPAFIIPVANALRDKKVILPGIICGILGYAIGNYLGIGISLLLGLLI